MGYRWWPTSKSCYAREPHGPHKWDITRMGESEWFKCPGLAETMFVTFHKDAFEALLNTLKKMDLQQRVTDDLGQRELAWYYWCDDVAKALGVPVERITNPDYDGD